MLVITGFKHDGFILATPGGLTLGTILLMLHASFLKLNLLRQKTAFELPGIS